MPPDHPIEMGEAGLDTGLDRSVPRLSTMRVHPDHRVREQLKLPDLFTKQASVATLPTVAGDHYDGAASHSAASPTIQERADHLTKPGASRPVGHQPSSAGQRLLSLARPQSRGYSSQASTDGEDLDVMRYSSDDPMC